jgi:hypothetical protein
VSELCSSLERTLFVSNSLVYVYNHSICLVHCISISFHSIIVSSVKLYSLFIVISSFNCIFVV